MRPITVTVGPLASASANAIALSQTPLAAGAITLNGASVVNGVAVLDTPRQALFTFAADETGHNFIVTGTDWAGDTISETVAGTTAGTVATVLSYKTIMSITISAAATGALTVGTNTIADSQWVRLDEWASPTVSIQLTVTGTVNYTVQQSMQDPNSPTNAVTVSAMTWVSSPDPNAIGASTTLATYFNAAPLWAKVTLNSGSGSVSAVFSQLGVAPY